MDNNNKPLAIIMAGAPGSGKSFLWELINADPLYEKVNYLNLDDKLAIMQSIDPSATRDEAVAWRNGEIDRHFKERKSFATETVFGPEKLDLLKEAKGLGFLVEVRFVAVDNPDIAKSNIDIRVQSGKHEVSDKSVQFTYSIDDQALQQAQLMDGKLMLITNTQDLSPTDLFRRYKSLADIERGFRVLKSEIEIGPVYHHLPDRIKAHASICFIALILYRVMRQRLHAADAKTSPEKALAQMRRIQHHRITLNGNQPNAGLSTTSTEQAHVLAALNLTKPRLSEQLTLL